MIKEPLKISGAGISGLCAAITASKSNIAVEVRDAAKSIEEKRSRGINAVRNYNSETDILSEYRDMGFKLEKFHPIYRQVYATNTVKTIEIESEDRPIFYTTSRGIKGSIDHLLESQAISQGIKVKWDSQFEKSDILATGPKYNHCIGYGEHFVDVTDISTILVFQNPKYTPNGYICILPYTNNEATVILGTFNPQSSASLKRNYQHITNNISLFKEFIKDATKRNTLVGTGNFGLPESALNGKTLVVGERAGFLGAYRGYGIDNAIRSGHIAGKAIVNGSNYDELWKKLLKESLTRGILRRLAENHLNLGSEKILDLAIKNLPKTTTVTDFRAEIKKIERGLLEQVDISELYRLLEQWNKQYPFP